MKFTKEEKILLTMYAYLEREESLEAFQELKARLDPVDARAAGLADSVIGKLGKISDQAFDQIEFFPDELIPMILEKSVDEVGPEELYDVVTKLKEEFEF